MYFFQSVEYFLNKVNVSIFATPIREMKKEFEYESNTVVGVFLLNFKSSISKI